MKTGSIVGRSFIVFSLSMFFLIFSSVSARVMADDYVEPTFSNFARTLVRYGAINVKDDYTLDGFAEIEECALHKNFYKDEFKWKKIRPALRESIRSKVATYPTGYYFDTPIHLGKYDFQTKKYSFGGEKPIKNFNMFAIKTGDDNYCGRNKIDFLPNQYNLVMDKVFQMDGIPLSEDDAKMLLAHMERQQNTDREVYARFNMRVKFVAILARESGADGKVMGPLIQSKKDGVTRIDTRLDSVDFYEDKEKTKIIYSYRP